MGSTYGDLFEGWEIALARRAVSRFQASYPWLKGLDFDDLLQECLIHWYLNRARFREGTGASMKTYMARILNTKLQHLLRQQLTDKRKAIHLAESLDKPLGEDETTLADVIAANECPSDIVTKMDIEPALDELTPLQRTLCNFLGKDYPVKKVAEMMGKPRSTIRDEIKRVREIFSRKGLKDYWK